MLPLSTLPLLHPASSTIFYVSILCP
ncbi:hypothetical protein E2C01_068317 [Portunus trituberculatus]|uniref:Uncharacterized protein n=1 Tax=Portunus trituberculatus TaxID=210409 RepID=A0A5B7HZP9_PORTR|nr:hypothetical protein [Portunus trituberculatus]